MLIAPVYTSVCFGFTVLGSYLLCLTALAWLEDKPKGSVFTRARQSVGLINDWYYCADLHFKIKYGYRLVLGIVMLLLSMLK
jgi:hypothetical protein